MFFCLKPSAVASKNTTMAIPSPSCRCTSPAPTRPPVPSAPVAATMDTSWDDAVLKQACRSLVHRILLGSRKDKRRGRRSSASSAASAACEPPRKKLRKDLPGPAAPPAQGATPGGVTHKELQAHLDLHRWPCASTGPTITVGSDCSGLDSVMVALNQMGLGVRVKLQFCSDNDPTCQAFLQAKHKPHRFYTDVVGKDITGIPRVDIYSAGFPCQPWSSDGKGQGRRDKHGRGKIFDHIVAYITERLPKAFLLENVVGLTWKLHRKAFNQMLETLRQSGRYFVSWRILNACDFGIPQNRPRLFIVGMLRSAVADTKGFPWPTPRKKQPLPLKRFLCGGPGILMTTRPAPGTQMHRTLQEGLAMIKREGGDPDTLPYAVDVHSGRGVPHRMLNQVPCITRTRGGSGGYYITNMHRGLTVEEMLNLQGLPTHFAKDARMLKITDRHLGLMVGNAMATNVLKLLLSRLLTKLGLHQ